MYRPMMFSAAHSALFEQARRQSQEHVQAQPQFLWKRGFHSEGGLAGWGYYLEHVPPEDHSRIDEDQEEREGSTSTEDVEEGHEEVSSRHEDKVGQVGDVRANNAAVGKRYPASKRAAIASHARRIARQAVQRAKMAIKTHALVSLWFALTVPVIFWDAAYCFMRPRSMVGGDLHWIWKPYEIYQEVDYVYGVKAFQEGDGFTNAQSALNIVENCMNIVYLYLAHVSGSSAAPLVGFASAIMTLSKTVLYWLQEYYCGGCAVGHNDFQTLLLYWIIPNGLWLVVPTYIIWQLGKDITSALRVANKTGVKTKKQ